MPSAKTMDNKYRMVNRCPGTESRCRRGQSRCHRVCDDQVSHGTAAFGGRKVGRRNRSQRLEFRLLMGQRVVRWSLHAITVAWLVGSIKRLYRHDGRLTPGNAAQLAAATSPMWPWRGLLRLAMVTTSSSKRLASRIAYRLLGPGGYEERFLLAKVGGHGLARE